MEVGRLRMQGHIAYTIQFGRKSGSAGFATYHREVRTRSWYVFFLYVGGVCLWYGLTPEGFVLHQVQS